MIERLIRLRGLQKSSLLHAARWRDHRYEPVRHVGLNLYAMPLHGRDIHRLSQSTPRAWSTTPIHCRLALEALQHPHGRRLHTASPRRHLALTRPRTGCSVAVAGRAGVDVCGRATAGVITDGTGQGWRTDSGRIGIVTGRGAGADTTTERDRTPTWDMDRRRATGSTAQVGNWTGKIQ